MKKIFGILLLVVFTASFLFLNESRAQEKTGFVKKFWRNILSLVKKPVEQAEKALPAAPQSKPGTQQPIGVTPEQEPETAPHAASKGESEGEAEEQPKKSPLEDISKEELIERITYMVNVSPEIDNRIPELRTTRDEEFEVISIEYQVDGVFYDISELEKEKLMAIYNRVANERTIIQTERIQMQLQTIKPPPRIPQPPPQVHTPPNIPKPPPQPPTPPKIPTPPKPPQAPPQR